MQQFKWFFLLFILSLAACSHLSEQKKMEKLESMQSLYWKALRWNAPDTAANVIRYRNPARKFALINPIKNVQVTNYHQISSTRNVEEDTVTVHVMFDYINKDTGKVAQLRDREVWWFDEKTKGWYLDGDFPDFQQTQ